MCNNNSLLTIVTVDMVQCKKVNKVFSIGSGSFARGASSRSYNEFVCSHSGVNFIIPCETLMLCMDSFFASTLRSALQMSVSWMWNYCTSWAICEGCKVIIKMLTLLTLPINIQPHKPHNINYKNFLINLYKLLIHYMMILQIPTGECVTKPCIVP